MHALLSPTATLSLVFVSAQGVPIVPITRRPRWTSDAGISRLVGGGQNTPCACARKKWWPAGVQGTRAFRWHSLHQPETRAHTHREPRGASGRRGVPHTPHAAFGRYAAIGTASLCPTDTRLDRSQTAALRVAVVAAVRALVVLRHRGDDDEGCGARMRGERGVRLGVSVGQACGGRRAVKDG